MKDVFPIAHPIAVTRDMRMKPDRQRGTFRVSRKIPPPFAKLALPHHLPLVVEGSFGTMISQWHYKDQYTICAEYFDFRKPCWVKMNIYEPCTVFYHAVKNEPVIYKRIGQTQERIVVRQDTMEQLVFTKPGTDHRIAFEQNIYVAIHLAVPQAFQALLQDEDWIFQRLKEYDSVVHYRGQE